MKKMWLLLIVCAICCVNFSIAFAEIAIIPKPVKVVEQSGSFTLNAQTKLLTSEPSIAERCRTMFTLATGFAFPVADTRPASNYIALTIDPSLDDLSEEAYRLTVDTDSVAIRANHTRGLYYGLQTLRQLLPVEIYSDTKVAAVDWKIPAVRIEDEPRFQWRGMMLDCSRQFFPAEFVKDYIDWLAVHKINLFHWHLTDDDGWRIEIKQYPKLTELGAWRGEDEVLPPSRGSGAERYGGFYTHEQIREIVAYAAERNIRIMPEIDVPGHGRAATASYPEILCEGVGDTKSVQGISKNVWCAGREENFEMLDAIIAETAELFPFEYIHIGGDEVNQKAWANCSRCKKLMQQKGFQNTAQIQNYFIKRMEKIVRNHGKNMIGWNEILHGGKLEQDTAIMSWIGTGPGIHAAKLGHPVIMAPGPYMYFDMKQAPGERGHWWAGIVTTEKSYSFDPFDFDLPEDKVKNIFGVQACLWSEYLNEPPHYAEHQSYPRICALSEVGWTPQKLREYEDFNTRLGKHLPRLGKLGIHYRVPQPTAVIDKGVVTIQPPFEDTQVRYTTNGTEPTEYSKLYTGPFECADPDKLRCRTYMGDNASGVKKGAERADAAKWKPSMLSAQFKPVDFDITDTINKGGVWYATFDYTSGAHKLVIRSVELLCDGKTIARDEHQGETGTRDANNKYRLPVDSYDPEAKYVLRADIRADGGTNSHGGIVIERSPYLEPAAAVTTSMNAYGSNTPENAVDYNRGTYFWTNHPPRKGDLFTFTFDEPVTADQLEVRTGMPSQANRDILTDGIVEISSDGKTFTEAGGFEMGTAKVELTQKLKAVRIRVTADSPESWLIIQDIVLK
ncbi:Beta-hexosaminidase [Anaerohalosphaera lusitana]|uniref:beta-N-acetylhexosaminidase n=1 Tax=Anaerohalosphaera lusitana TaxID=1936003 RepID=A0A1U9NHC5_9BACT|nr:family 20 glycosylhydrolase [Anaerohalosphaera lusitana]AQT67319.1 Beta-hexosaminidase [Anaerohalosphaera lusitana]